MSGVEGGCGWDLRWCGDEDERWRDESRGEGVNVVTMEEEDI